MGKVIILTDSAADIPREMISALDIEMVPFKVTVDGETFLDQVTLDTKQYYEKLRQAQTIPTTSQPSPHDFAAAYQRCIDRGATEILAILVSSALSGTYQSSLIAKEILKDQQVHIESMDSCNATFCLGQMVVNAARAAQEGKTIEQCKEIALQTRANQTFYFYLDTLEYLQKGGRIGKAASMIGSLLNIKPLLSLDSAGTVISIDKVRGRKKVARRIFELVEQQVAPGSPVQLTILHGESTQEAEVWLRKYEELYDVQEKQMVYIGSCVTTHVGPEALGVLLVPVISP